MVELIQTLLLFLVVALSLSGFTKHFPLVGRIRRFAEKRRLAIGVVGGATILGWGLAHLCTTRNEGCPTLGFSRVGTTDVEC